jgi:hypothetical protein
VTITSAVENALVGSFRGANQDLRGWIGLTDEVTEGTFQWITGEPVTYTNWGQGEPSNGVPGVTTNEDYVEIFASTLWNDNTNSPGALNQGYIVEYEVNPFGPGGGQTPALLIDTGPASSPGFALIPTSASNGNFQFIAARFTLAAPTLITLVEGWMGAVSAGGMNIQIRSDANGLPGANVFSKSYAMVQASDTAWRSFPNLGATLNAGSYWLAFEPSTAFSSMPSGAQSPLGKYAIYFAPNGAYLDILNLTLPAGSLPSVGVRVWGMPSPPPCGSSCAP